MRVSINDIINYILKREEIDLENNDELENLKNKRILITGGLGSIGSEIVRMLVTINITKIIIYDNNEYNYFFLTNKINNYAYFKNIENKYSIKFILGDINDKEKLETVFKNNTIDYIYHTAAYKHVDIMEDHPYESVKVNILGTKIFHIIFKI